ncbi:MAG: DUF1611 domain-containing protein [Bacteroidia bacterium]
MIKKPEGNAIVYCQGAFNTPNGKTAHGLVRFTNRYKVLAVIDSRYAGKDAGEVLDGKPNGIPVVPSIHDAMRLAWNSEFPATHLVIGLAPDGGRVGPEVKADVILAITEGLHVVSGLHDFLSDDPKIASAAQKEGVMIRDVRKPPARDSLHFFSGKIEDVRALKIALLGTDSAVGKRTTAWILVHALNALGVKTELVGTGQTAWMQGARYGIIMDSLVNDFVSGEIEHAVHSAWRDGGADVIVIEGQGSLMNPAYPGGFEILAAGRPDIVVLQHAPARKEYDGFPGYPIHPLQRQIQAIEVLSDRKVQAITINHEEMSREQTLAACESIQKDLGLPVFDVLLQGAEGLAKVIMEYRK